MMKRVIAVLVILVMMLSMVGCSSDSGIGELFSRKTPLQKLGEYIEANGEWDSEDSVYEIKSRHSDNQYMETVLSWDADTESLKVQNFYVNGLDEDATGSVMTMEFVYGAAVQTVKCVVFIEMDSTKGINAEGKLRMATYSPGDTLEDFECGISGVASSMEGYVKLECKSMIEEFEEMVEGFALDVTMEDLGFLNL